MRYAIPAFCSGLILLACNAPAAAQSYSADLAANIECLGDVTPALEATIENFLVGRGFKVANLERVRRQYGKGFYPLEIEAYDNRRWTVHLISFGDPPSGAPSNPTKTSYHLGVYSPSPTHHDDVLEKDLVDLFSQQLNCEIQSSNRNENRPDAESFYDQIYSMQLSRDHEMEICDKTAKTYDADQCRKVPGVN